MAKHAPADEWRLVTIYGRPLRLMMFCLGCQEESFLELNKAGEGILDVEKNIHDFRVTHTNCKWAWWKNKDILGDP